MSRTKLQNNLSSLLQLPQLNHFWQLLDWTSKYSYTNPPAGSSACTSFSVFFSLRTCNCLVRGLFQKLHHLFGMLFLEWERRQCVCVCVCVWLLLLLAYLSVIRCNFFFSLLHLWCSIIFTFCNCHLLDFYNWHVYCFHLLFAFLLSSLCIEHENTFFVFLEWAIYVL